MSVGWLFTDRCSGESAAPYEGANLGLHVGDDPQAVIANRAELSSRTGGFGLATMSQVHGSTVLTASTAGEVGEADALVSTTSGIALVVQVADCVPVLLADESARVIGAVHAGWRGAAVDVVGAAVVRMQQLGAHVGAMQAYIGPAICGSCYEVGPEVVEQVGKVMPTAPGSTSWGTHSVDLRSGMRERLERLGIHSELVGECTFEHPATYFSYRRDGVTGRQAGVIWLQ
jgi:YfiH family protein